MSYCHIYEDGIWASSNPSSSSSTSTPKEYDVSPRKDLDSTANRNQKGKQHQNFGGKFYISLLVALLFR